MKKNKARSFKKGLLIYFVTAIIMIGIALVVFWKFLGSFEDSRPNLTAEAFMETVDDAYLEKLVIQSADLFPTTEFENSEAIASQCFEAIRGQNISIRRRSGSRAQVYTDEKPVYTIREGGSDLAVLTLENSGDAGFGYNTWQVAAVTLAEEFIPATREVKVTAPSEAAITINGVVLLREYETETTFFDKLTELEKTFENPLKTSVYTIKGIYGNLEIHVQMPDGEVLEPTVADGSNFVYERTEMPRTITIQASSAAALSICGAAVTEAYLSNEEALPKPNGVEEYIGDYVYPSLRTYVVPDLYTRELTIQAEENGNVYTDPEVFENGTLSFGWSCETISEERMEFLRDYSQRYIRYASNYGNSVSENWSSFGSYLLYGSDLYERMVEFQDGLSWTRSTQCDLKDCVVLHYLPCGEDCFLVRVRMEYTVTRRNGTREEAPTFDLFFVRDGSSYSAALMNICE